MKRYIQTLGVNLAILLVAAAVMTSCNKDTNSDEDPSYKRGTELVVTKFYLKADNKIMSKLDSVYFAIDVVNGIIYNADSLPVGTPIDKLIPMITVPSSTQRVSIVMENESDGTITTTDYKKNPGDTIDFTKKVTLELAILDEEMTRNYQIKVNVHKMNPDSLSFDMNARMALPSRKENPISQKTVSRNGLVSMMIEEADASLTLASTEKMEEGTWNRRQVTLPEKANIESFTASSDAYYILGQSGRLYRSLDAADWEYVGVETWISIIGAYGDKVIGVRNNGGSYLHTQYPLGTYNEVKIDETFPYRNSTPMSVYTTKWSSLPLGLITGGESQSGLTGATWAFDGNVWCNISDTPLPAVSKGTMIPYFAYLKSSAMWLFNEYSIWMYVGGVDAEGNINKTVYLSYDNGVHWEKAPVNMQLPEEITNYGCYIGHAIIDTPMDADFSPTVWKNYRMSGHALRKLPYVINGYNITWNCPYIYLTGGTRAEGGSLNPWIYKGVLNRMTFKPLI